MRFRWCQQILGKPAPKKSGAANKTESWNGDLVRGTVGRPQVVAPGVAHADTIRAFHSAKFMEHACAQNCVLDVR